MSACPAGPVPPMGWHLWRGPVSPALSKWAVSLLNGIGNVPYGQTWEQPTAQLQVLAIKQHHTWTYRGGKLVTGICIPGITLYYKPLSPTPPSLEEPPALPSPGDTAAFNEAPTDWPMVAVSAGAIVTVSILFALALRYAGSKSKR